MVQADWVLNVTWRGANAAPSWRRYVQGRGQENSTGVGVGVRAVQGVRLNQRCQNNSVPSGLTEKKNKILAD